MISINIDGAQMLYGVAAIIGALGVATPSFLAWRAAKKATQAATDSTAASKANAATLATVTKKIDDVAIVTDQTQTNTNGLSERSEVAAHAVGYAKGVSDGLAAAQAKLGADALAREQGPTTAQPATEPGTAS